MKYLAHTLTNYLISACRNAIKTHHENHEIRIFLDSFTPKVILSVGERLEDFTIKGPLNIELVYKVGRTLWDEWLCDKSQENQLSCKEIENRDWVDKDDKFTYYRDLKWSNASGKDYLLIVLVGVDKAADKGSLEDFFHVTKSTIWENYLDFSFEKWIINVFRNKSITYEKEHIQDIDALLKSLHRYGVGDIVRISSFLEEFEGQVDAKGVQDGRDALRVMYGMLQSWDLPLLKDMSKRKKWTRYIEDAISFFSYQPYLKSAERKKAIKKILQFKKSVEDLSVKGPSTELSPVFNEFYDSSDFFETLERYINKNNPIDRKRLLKIDFAFIKDKILDFKKPVQQPRDKIQKISGPPLQAVLTSIWMTLIDFRKLCNQKRTRPGKVIKTIKIKSLRFKHDFGPEQTDSARDLIRGILGGIDEFIHKFIQIKIEVEGDTREIPITCNLCGNIERLILDKSRTAMPNFQLEVSFIADDGLSLSKVFQWQLPDIHGYRNLWNLARIVKDHLYQHEEPYLPVFGIPFFNEMFLTPDEDEANRILKQSISRLRIWNLLRAPNIDRQDPLWPFLADLSNSYKKFLDYFVTEGYFVVMEDLCSRDEGSYADLFKKMQTAMRLLVADKKFSHSTLLPLLYKAFLILDESSDSSSIGFFWNNYIESAIVTGLHPSLFEMLRHRETFLSHAFEAILSEALGDVQSSKTSMKNWEDICDLAKIERSLFGIISNNNKDLDTTVKTFDLIQLVGTPAESHFTLMTKLFLRPDFQEEEEISDTDLFFESKESKVITRIFNEYVTIHQHGNDGLTIAVIGSRNLQVIIAALDSFLRGQIKTDENQAIFDRPPYHLNLIFFVRTSESQNFGRWLIEWRKRWESSQTNDKFSYYKYCEISISQRIANKYEDYINQIVKEIFDVDIALLSHFIISGKSGNDVVEMKPYEIDLNQPLKFPAVEMPCCSEEHPAKIFHRARVISNRQFRLSTLHSEMSARIKHPYIQEGKQHIVICQSDFEPWVEIVDELHKKSSWVFCLDPSVDERLVGLEDSDKWKREIIGFASGVGSHGELNYTVSTERTSLVDIEKEIQNQVNRLFGPWDSEDLEKAAHLLVSKSRKLSGLSLVRATGPSEYVRDLIAYTLTRICLPNIHLPFLCLCDELISLDTFSHWFDSATNQERPDLMRLMAFLVDGKIEVYAQLIECKLAKYGESYLEKAHIQLENGLRHLITIFKPRQVDGIGRFDRRFWWTQLERLIANKSRIKPKVLTEVTSALEMLGDGYFTIHWQAMAVIYSTDKAGSYFNLEKKWDYTHDAQRLEIQVISIGKELIYQICCEGKYTSIPLPDSDIVFTSTAKKDDADQEDEIIIYRKDLETDGLSDDKTSVIDNRGKGIELPNDTGIPARVYLGSTNVGQEVYWEFGHPGLNNRHMLIFGRSGSGKTYAIQAILCELALQNQNSVIIDYTNGFEESKLEPEAIQIIKPTQHIVQHKPLPINPFRRQISTIAGRKEPEKISTTSQRVMSVFASVYNLGDQQKNALYQAIKKGIEKTSDKMNLRELVSLLESSQDGLIKDSAITLLNKLNPFVDGEPFGEETEESWLRFYNDQDNRCHIIQLVGCGKEFSTLVTEFALIDLYYFARGIGDQYHPKVVVLDEIQNLDHGQEGPLAGFLTEGRKFGLSMILATQTLRTLKEEARHRLFQAEHKLFFKPAETEIVEYAKILERSTGESSELWVGRLNSLKKGECYSLGPSLNNKTSTLEVKAYKIKITSLSDRLKKIGVNK